MVVLSLWILCPHRTVQTFLNLVRKPLSTEKCGFQFFLNSIVMDGYSLFLQGFQSGDEGLTVSPELLVTEVSSPLGLLGCRVGSVDIQCNSYNLP